MPRSVESEGGEQHADEGTARSPEETDRQTNLQYLKGKLILN